MGYTKVTKNNWDIRLLVTIKVLLADILWIAGQICTIKLVLESAYQTVSDNIVYFIVISIYRDTSISV